MGKQKILLIDDDEKYSEVLKEFLEFEGYEVVCASDESEGRRQMENESFALAIVDLYLQGDDNENDPTGMRLVIQAPNLRKLVLTGKPTTETVRRSLASLVNGRPAAVGYVYKEDGLEELLRAIRLALLPMHSVVESSLLRGFDVAGTVALNNRIEQAGTDETLARFDSGFKEASQRFAILIEKENRRVAQLHFAGLFARYLGFAGILVGGAFFLAGSIAGGLISLAATVLTNVINSLFSVREDAAHKRVETLLAELKESQDYSRMFSMTETLKESSDRDSYKMQILDHLLRGGKHGNETGLQRPDQVKGHGTEEDSNSGQ